MTAFEETFAALRGVLDAERAGAIVQVDRAGDYQLASATMRDRVGRPLMIGAVQIRKTYVAYHLMPIYMNAPLRESVSPALQRRMHGKACFKFTKVEPGLLTELAAVTKRGIAAFDNAELPWTKKGRAPEGNPP